MHSFYKHTFLIQEAMMYFKFNTGILPRISHMNLFSSSQPYLHFRRIPGEYILFIVRSGTLYLSEDGRDYCLNAGDMLILEPDKMHTGTQPSVCSYYYIHLDTAVFENFTPESDMSVSDFFKSSRQMSRTVSPFALDMYDAAPLILPKSMHVNDSAAQHKIELFMEQAIFASDRRDEHYKLICSACFIQIIIVLAQYFSSYTLATASGSSFTRSQQLILAELTEYLHENYNKKLSGAELESHFQMNFDYLNRLFRKKNGTPIFSYLNSVRISKAVEMLTSSNIKAYEIARAVGFSDEFYFSKIFKKYMGVSPKNYLKTHQ